MKRVHVSLMKIAGGLESRVIAPNLDHRAFLSDFFFLEETVVDKRWTGVSVVMLLTELRAQGRDQMASLMIREGGNLAAVCRSVDLWLFFVDSGWKIGGRGEIARVTQTRRPLE
jgi:hypothetical protein